MRAKFLFLGTGSSSGVPSLGCNCNVCLSLSEKNKRLRSSALLKLDKKSFLLDVSPDFRQQGLRYEINHIDGLMLTHPHYDHLGGLDDLRAFNFLKNEPIPCLLSKETLEELKKGYHYIFKPSSKDESLSTRLNFLVLKNDMGEVLFEGIKIFYLSFYQKATKVTGFRIGDLAYISDIKEYDDSIFSQLKNLNILVVSALRPEPSPLQFSLEEAKAFSKKVGAKKTYFTHIAHEIDHEKISKELIANHFLAYDGLELEFEYGG
jgi:phosphoribosyl 1,2-cyclic phosphate phosphodiesterase